VALYLPIGKDAHDYYLRDWWPGASAPAWLFIITAPVGRLPWPVSYALLSAATVLGVGGAATVFDQRGWRWWLAVLSPSLLQALGWGQIEIVPLLGAVLAWLVLTRHWPMWWMGVAWLALLTKPQSGLGVALAVTVWLVSERRAIWQGLVTAAGILLVSIALWGIWWPSWLQALSGYAGLGATIWPFGLLALPLVLWPTTSRQVKLGVTAAVFTLASPYLLMHHLLTLQVVTGDPLLWAAAWLLMVLQPTTADWSPYVILLPAACLVGQLALPAIRQRFGSTH
jgi:hypothetical protein